ncbi:hypothetical protein [Shivajiella indica]|uniref:DUF3187 family protein n=1 Tax=Shivajiella indica TaxID=872115 RepID=A0ABW5B3V8_9BACT
MKTRIILFFITLAMGVCHKNFGQIPSDLLSLHPNSWKFPHKDLSFFYDQENLSLKYGHDTLEVFILGNKKIAYRWHDIQRQKDFNGWYGFEADIDLLMEMLEKLELNFTANNYEIVFSPESERIKTRVLPEARYAIVGEEMLPVFRHKITLTYYSYLMEIDFFLGEIDELLILKSSGINDVIKSHASENYWYKEYVRKNFNKALIIDEEGNFRIDTFRSRENPYYPRTNLELGAGYVFGYSVGMNFQPRVNFRLRTKKTNINKHTLFLAFNGLLSHIPDGEKPFEIAQDYFLGVGQESDLIGNNVAVMLGFRIFGYNGILENNNVMFKIDFSVTPKLKIFWSLYQSPNFSQDIPSANFLGLNYVIF